MKTFMRTLLTSQLDYIFFFYGFSFILLGTAALALLRLPSRPFKPAFLAAFCLIHGILEWLDLLALSLGDSPSFQILRFIVMTLSFVCLFEFGRRNSRDWERLSPHLKTLILAVITLISFSGFLENFAGGRATARYGFGLFGALLSALVFLRSPGIRPTMAILMALYGIAAGLITTRAPFFPASVLNHDSFLDATGLPIQLIRGILATLMAASGFLIVQKFRAGEQSSNWLLRRAERTFRGHRLVLMILLCLGAGALGVRLQEDAETRQLKDFLVQRGFSAAAFLPRDSLTLLERQFTDEHLGDPSPLLELLRRFLKANPDLHRLTLQGYRNTRELSGFIYYLILDNDVESGKESARSFQPMDRAVDPADIRLYLGLEPHLISERSDTHGKWISLTIPVLTRADGSVEIAMTLDIDAADWKYEIAVNRLVVIGAVLLLCLFVLAVYLLVHARSETLNLTRSSEVRYRAIVENTRDAILVLKENVPVFANAAATALIGDSLLSRVHPDDQGALKALLGRASDASAASTPETDLRASVRFVRSDQSIRSTEANARPLILQNETFTLLIIQDLTETRNLQNQLLHSEKLASIGTLAAGIAHEINNPLMIIRGFQSLLRDRTRDPSQLPMFDKQERAIQRIAQIVNGLRTYARADTEHLGPLDINATIEDTLSLISPLIAKAGIRFEIHLSPSLPAVNGNIGKLQQVLINLLTNAKDALESHPDPLIEISTRMEGHAVLLEVRDNGRGIPQELHSKIFDPFFTTKPPGKGTGLGLAISQSIVGSFGGKIRLESAPKQGTSFVLELVPTDPRPEEATPPHLTRRGRVLVVDDEEDIRELLGEILKSQKWNVEYATDGEDAWHKLLPQDCTYELLITDLKMPKMSGLTLVSKLGELPHRSAMKCIVMTGGVTTDFTPEQRELLKYSAHGYLLKPFDAMQVERLIDRTLADNPDHQNLN